MEKAAVVESWPQNSLESVDHCPVCKGAARELLYKDLRDQVFFCAPGLWTLYRCTVCGSAYLDPRPSIDAIHLAYSNYFTHEGDKQKLKVTEWARRALANGYRNRKYGTSLQPSTILGWLAALALPRQRAILDWGMRNLPKASRGARLLDVGCGNGDFLVRAKSAGWDVVGVDPDPKAVAVARSRGLDVRLGSIENFTTQSQQFDGITLSHVVEHVHDPGDLLRGCHRLLKHGGWLWIETPNVESQGRRLYKSKWLPLDPPRHLVLFTLESLGRLLEQVGFRMVDAEPWAPICSHTFAASQAIAEGIDPIKNPRKTLRALMHIVRSESLAKQNPQLREYITLRAFKE